jgi:hypothetical protein
LQLLTADEKVDELAGLVNHKDNEIAQLKNQLQSSMRPELLKEKVEQIVQKEVEDRVRNIQMAM